MKKTIRTLVTTSVAMLVLGAAGATTAAAHEWRQFGAPLVTAKEVQSTSTLTFENTAEGTTMRCALHQKGKVGPGAVSEITSITSEAGATKIPCTVVEDKTQECKTVEVEAFNLPWKSELVTLYEGLRNKLFEEPHHPEWRYYCGPSGDHNWCGVAPSAAIKNSTGGVEVIDDSKTPKTRCLVGQGEPFRTTGTSTFSFVSKGGLEAV